MNCILYKNNATTHYTKFCNDLLFSMVHIIQDFESGPLYDKKKNLLTSDKLETRRM